MAGSNSHKGSVLPPSGDLDFLKLQYEHEEKTIWPERMLFAKAAVLLLGVITIGSMVLLVFAAYKTDHIDKVIQVAGNIIIGVLSFFAGRSSRR